MRRSWGKGSQGAFLSVVIPVHDVARWLPACLDSVLVQPVGGLQVVVVDDGSTDGSSEILADYTARESRMELLSQENSGVSIARNNAIRQCTGEYLTFVDPDDVLPEDAWSSMLATLDRTGSDFAVGRAERVDKQRRFVTPLMERNHRRQRLGIRIEDQPLMLADVFVWNKIFRRSFWDRAGIEFPERTRYQDQPALTRAFLAAESFDVLTETVYDWAVRPSGGSATQLRRDLDNLQERVATKRMTADMVAAHGSAELHRVLHAEIFPIDMWEHFRAVPRADEEYWTVLRDAVREFWGEHTVRFELTTIPVQQRLMGCLVAQGRRDDLIELIAFLDGFPGSSPVVNGRLQHPWADDPSLPREVTIVRR